MYVKRLENLDGLMTVIVTVTIIVNMHTNQKAFYPDETTRVGL